MEIREPFRRFAHRASELVGTPWAFMMVVWVIVIWAISGPVAHFSDTWQLVINTTSSIVTLLMVFLIQNTQNRDTREIHLKLDELLRSVRKARDSFISLEKLPTEQLDQIQQQFERLRDRERREKPAENLDQEPEPL